MWALTFMNLLVVVLRGSPKFDSIIGIETCSTASWAILAGFCMFLFIVTVCNFRAVKAEQELKKTYGRGILPSDIDATKPKSIIIVMCAGFFSSYLGGILGQSGSVIFNPV